MKQQKVIKFPQQKKTVKIRRIKNIDGFKYFNESQIKLIRRTAKDQAVLDKTKGNVTAIREWMAIDLITSTGMRVAEASNIRCGDIKAGYSESAIFIRDGKGSKSRTVQIPDSLKKHFKSFLRWKAGRNESIDHNDHLFIGQRGPWTSQAVQQTVKKYLRQVNLYESGKSAHALRHSYAVQFYRQAKDLRGLQKQLGHASIQTTQIYADVLDSDIQDQIKGLWN